MKILQSGVPKCGNFWLYKIIQEILTRTGRSTRSFIEQQPIYHLAKKWDLNVSDQARIDTLEVTDLRYSYRISSIFRMPVDDITKYVERATHVWTHSPVCKRTGSVLGLFDKKIHIIRDPRDRAISAATYYCSDYMLKYFPQEEKNPALFLAKNFEKLMHEWVWHVFDYLRISARCNIHIAFFEGFRMGFQRELTRLLDYLEVDLPASQREALKKAVSFSVLKTANPGHLQKGISGRWMKQLTGEQIEKAEIIAGPLIRYLGYPAGIKEEMTFSANREHQNFEALKQDIIRSQERLYQA